jgi:hypothetical protein
MGSGTNARQRLVSFVTALLGTALLCLAFRDIVSRSADEVIE